MVPHESVRIVMLFVWGCGGVRGWAAIDQLDPATCTPLKALAEAAEATLATNAAHQPGRWKASSLMAARNAVARRRAPSSAVGARTPVCTRGETGCRERGSGR